ncbi:hypothetical protein J6590_027111 [Homalodisca vitripennis]|nr:hypothetical protein J6590_027111 [Homalodisca vitripennis]
MECCGAFADCPDGGSADKGRKIITTLTYLSVDRIDWCRTTPPRCGDDVQGPSQTCPLTHTQFSRSPYPTSSLRLPPSVPKPVPSIYRD